MKFEILILNLNDLAKNSPYIVKIFIINDKFFTSLSENCDIRGINFQLTFFGRSIIKTKNKHLCFHLHPIQTSIICNLIKLQANVIDLGSFDIKQLKLNSSICPIYIISFYHRFINDINENYQIFIFIQFLYNKKNPEIHAFEINIALEAI